MSLRRILFLVMGLVLVVGLASAGLLTSRQLESALLSRTSTDLQRAGMVLQDRWTTVMGLRMMHAKDLASVPGVDQALAAGDLELAIKLLEPMAAQFGEAPLIVDAQGNSMVGGMNAPPGLAEKTLDGAMPVDIADMPEGLQLMALAPVVVDGEWVAAVGSTTPFDTGEAGTLAGLTRTGVVFMTTDEGPVATSTTLSDSVTSAVLPSLANAPLDSVMAVDVGADRHLLLAASFKPGLRILFSRNLTEEFAILPGLRKTALFAGGGALAFALLMAAVLAGRIARPVVTLANAADRLADGDVDAPVPSSSVTELSRMAQAFDSMRAALHRRLEQLRLANTELEDRQVRLARLQAELVQRERAASAGQLASHLAHEIRNPIASVRNCLEVLKRRAGSDQEATRFADLAIDELLRMHELAERMLGLGRQPEKADEASDGVNVASEVAALINAGGVNEQGSNVAVIADRKNPIFVGMSGDSLKQVLFNLVLNAREASVDTPVEIVVSASSNPATIEVLDRGPGIKPENLDRIFDPFFSTKDKVRGVGLGLFMAQAMIQAHRGRLYADNRTDGPGARFVLELPLADPASITLAFGAQEAS